MSGCPKLENFTDASGWMSDEGEATPRQVSKTFHIRSNAFKHLSLDSVNEGFYEEGFELSEGDVMESLAHMQVLETISMNSLAVYNPVSPEGGQYASGTHLGHEQSACEHHPRPAAPRRSSSIKLSSMTDGAFSRHSRGYSGYIATSFYGDSAPVSGG